jgi:hypothetical protein
MKCSSRDLYSAENYLYCRFCLTSCPLPHVGLGGIPLRDTRLRDSSLARVDSRASRETPSPLARQMCRRERGRSAPTRSRSLLTLHYSRAAQGFELSLEQIPLNHGMSSSTPNAYLSSRKEANRCHEAAS